MRFIQRSEKILESLKNAKYSSFEELKNEINCSISTVRRDIKKLQDQGRIFTSHGSICIKDFPNNKSFYQSSENLTYKKQISEKAASLISQNDSVIINGGSTCFYMHEYINQNNVNIFTNSFILASEFIYKNNIKLSIGGGTIVTKDRLIQSPHNENIIDHLYASKYFLGAKSINEIGLLESDPAIINYDNMLMKRSKKIIVLADSSKFNYVDGCYSSISLDKIDTLITDSNIEAKNIKMLEKYNINVIIV